jgi:hypothetical protein
MLERSVIDGEPIVGWGRAKARRVQLEGAHLACLLELGPGPEMYVHELERKLLFGRYSVALEREDRAMERATPILPADDLGAAKSFYVDGLGFSIRFEVSSDGKNELLGLERGTMYLTLDSPMSGHGPRGLRLPRGRGRGRLLR